MPHSFSNLISGKIAPPSKPANKPTAKAAPVKTIGERFKVLAAGVLEAHQLREAAAPAANVASPEDAGRAAERAAKAEGALLAQKVLAAGARGKRL